MDVDNIFYRIPTVGAIVENKELKMNSIFPQLDLQYKLNNEDWKNYKDDKSKVTVSMSDLIKVRARNSSNTRFGRALTVKLQTNLDIDEEGGL